MRKLLLLTLLALWIFQFSTAVAQEDEMLYKTHCAACHTIGKGRLVGPDLSGISSKYSEKWLIGFIKSSKSMIESGDPDAVAIANEYFNIVMPDFKGSDADVKSILQYINNSSEKSELIVEEEEKAIKIMAGDADSGKLYFEGELAFESKGASCISCHHVSYPHATQGGLLAKDLSKSYNTMGGEAGIHAILTSSPFPSMQETYKSHPLNPSEIEHLTMYLKASSEQTQINKAVIISDTFLIGMLILVLLFFLISLIWAKRKKNIVNKQIFERQAK